MQPGSPEYEAKLQADIARLQAAKGIQLRAWMRENKTLVVVLALYLGVVGLYSVIALARGESPLVGAVIGTFFGPLVLLRGWARWRRRR